MSLHRTQQLLLPVQPWFIAITLFVALELGSYSLFALIPLAVGQDMATIQRQAILATLQHCGGDKQKAAELLKISERKLWYKLKEYGES